MPVIYYVSTIFRRPAGGVRTIFRHVAALRAMGWDARVVSSGDDVDRPSWFPVDVPIVKIEDRLTIQSSDVLVIPEVHAPVIEQAKNIKARKVAFFQNQYGMFEGLRNSFSDWREANVHYALHCSETVRHEVERCFSFDDSAVVRCVIDTDVFRPLPKKPCIVAMPRKRAISDLTMIRRAFVRIWPRYAQVPWIGLVNRSEADVARNLGMSAVFLSLSYREGLGLPPLEAMSCGCLVAGFTGLGGREYATRDNGFWVREDDLFGAAEAVGQALHTAVTDPGRAHAMQASGHKTVGRYNQAGMEDDLRAFWTRMVGPPEAHPLPPVPESHAKPRVAGDDMRT